VAAPTRPTLPTGPAGDHLEAMQARKLRAVVWFGLDPAKLLSFNPGTPTSTLTAIERVTAKRGKVVEWKISSDGETATYEATLWLTGPESDELWKHLGPPPKPAALTSIWNLRGPLPPGSLLYNADGDVIGEVGQVIPAAALGGYDFLVTS
jgi:hypothetical protein